MQRSILLTALSIICFFIIGVLIWIHKTDFVYPTLKPKLSLQWVIKKQDPVIVTAGDIACNSLVYKNSNECGQKQTADLIKKINPDAILALGDNQYDDPSLNGFIKYYSVSWGQFKDRTYPVAGNHDYDVQGATGYFDYFGSRAGQKGLGYYSFDIGGWHLVALNSNCWAVGGCQKGSTQQLWLEKDLSSFGGECILAYWHHPLFSAATHGDSSFMKDIWQTLQSHKATIVLSGHDHVYERYVPQNADGIPSPLGITEFVVGTGGKNLYPFKQKQSTMQASQNTAFGILKLTLHKNSYDFEYLPVSDSTFKDIGSGKCQ